jgi:outer membrane protein TolC
MAYETQRSMLNDLLMDAMEAYWSWVKSYRVLQIVQKNRDIATLRVDFVKRMVALGERPAVDTLEALTQQQSFENAFQAKLLEFDNAGLDLSVFLWQENNTPVMLEKDVFPGELDQAFGLLAQFDLQLPSLLEKANSNHPELNAYQFKIDALNVEKKLKFQGLLPKLDLSYQRLSHEGSPIDASSWLNNNFYYGLKFEMPLRLSQGRAEYQQAKLKVQEESLNQSQKKQQIQVKIGRYFNQFESLRKQIETQEKATTNYFALVKAEETRFAQGESSLFLINNRETKAMEAAEKLTDLKAYLFKTIYALQASAGVLM